MGSKTMVWGMSRPLRIEFLGAFYHVTSGSDRREAIYTLSALPVNFSSCSIQCSPLNDIDLPPTLVSGHLLTRRGGLDCYPFSGKDIEAAPDPLYPLYPLDDAVETGLLAGIGLIAMGQLPLDADHGGFETGHAVLQVGNVVADLVDPAPNVAQMHPCRKCCCFPAAALAAECAAQHRRGDDEGNAKRQGVAAVLGHHPQWGAPRTAAAHSMLLARLF